MFIQTETTDYDDVIRFLPGRTVLEAGSAEFPDLEAAVRSPLASALLRIEGVDSIILGTDHILVTKLPESDWTVLKPPVLGVIMEHFVAGRPTLHSDLGDGEAAMVRGLIETRINPALEPDGSRVTLASYEEGVVSLMLAAGSSTGPTFALKVKIENTLRHFLPQIVRVEFAPGSASQQHDADDAEERPGLDTPEGLAIKRLLDERINPAVAAHGGYIALIDVQETRAFIRLEGGCQGCGMADVTLKQGVEVEIMREVPSITEVLDVTDHGSGSNPFYQPTHK